MARTITKTKRNMADLAKSTDRWLRRSRISDERMVQERCANFPLLGDTHTSRIFGRRHNKGTRIEGDENGEIEKRIIPLEIQGVRHLRYFSTDVRRKGRLHCHRHEAEEQASHPISISSTELRVQTSRNIILENELSSTAE